MKVYLIVLSLFVSCISQAAEKNAAREPASICIKSPTIECMAGYEVRQVHGCFRCIHSAVGDVDSIVGKSCIKAPTLTCKQGYRTTQDDKGCFHCTQQAVTEPTCIRSPTLDCASGNHLSQDSEGCFHCIKE